MRNFLLPRRVLVLSFLLLLVGVLLPAKMAQADRSPSADVLVQQAWQRAQASGAYRFSTEIVQTTYPAPALVNVGRSSSEQRLYLEGDLSVAERTLQMALWQGGGSLFNAQDAVQMRVNGDQAYGRRTGGEWQEVEDFSGAFAPDNDPLAYLAGAKDVRALASSGMADGSLPAGYTRFAFDVDGPAFAEYLRSQMEDYLHRKGRLPGRLTLETADTFADVAGTGEIWLNAAGLPARMVVHMVYPVEANGERIEAEVRTDFSNFALLQADAPFLPVQLRSHLTPAALRRAAQQFSLGTGFLGLLAVVLVHRRSRLVYDVFVFVVIGSMLAVPLMESHQVAAFYDETSGDADVDAESDASGDSVRDLYEDDWYPHQDPLARAENEDLEAREGIGSPSFVRVDTTWDSNPLAQLAVVEEEPPEPDSDDDGDGLSYAHEMLLGTLPQHTDSDGDGIRDDAEVAGFEWPEGSGEWWYSDPNNPDTNGDGLADRMECWATEPTGEPPYSQPCDRDTDGDRVPDLFDTDNDGDGVPDREDLSPGSMVGSTSHAFGYDAPFEYQVNELQSDVPVFVDFQLRPVKDEHLTYALNVLDWPAGDHDGQIQRHATATADSTFKSVAEAAGDSYGAQDANGDMRLVPMLEITIPYDGGSYGNLPVIAGAPATRSRTADVDDWLDKAKLAPYGISVRKKGDNGTLLAYTPLNVVPDATGGGRVAFSGRMLYWPDAADAWGDVTHEARVVWLVVMLSDSCNVVPIGTSEEDAATWCDDVANWTLDQAQPVHTYPEDWYLTGLAVREDHGLDVAVMLEDPDTDSDPDHDDNLWLLASGLEGAFISARDADDNGVRDVAITSVNGDTTLSGRFDAEDMGAGITEEARWGIPLDQDLQVVTFSYDHQDHIAQVMMTETVQILDTYFTTASGDPKAAAPTLLFAREEHYRGANLDDAGAVSVSDREVTVIASQANALPMTMASVSWAPFRHRNGAWESYDMTEYWDLMEVRFREVFPPDDPDDPDSVVRALGQVELARSYYLSLFNGVTGLVRIGDNRVWEFSDEQTDDAMAKLALGVTKGVGAVVKKIATTLCQVIEEVLPVLKLLGGSLRVQMMFYYVGLRIQGVLQDVESALQVSALKARLSALRSGSGSSMSFSTKFAIGAAVAGAVVGLAVLAAVLARGGGAGDALKAVSLSLQIFGALTGALKALETFAKIKILGLTQVVKNFSNASQKAGIVGLIVTIVVTWAAFIAVWAVSGVMIGSLAWNAMLAGAIASTVLAVVMFAIGLHPVGLIIMAIVGLIDAVVYSLCTAFGWSEGKVGAWICKGITGLAKEAIQRIIYGNYVMVDMEADDRLNVSNYQQDIFDPAKGIAVGNSLAMSADITTTIGLAKVPENWMAYAFYWQYSQSKLKSATFDYALQPTDLDLHLTLSRNDMKDDWTETPDPDDGKDVYETWTVTTDGSSVSLTDAGAGINRPVALYLSEGHAVPAQECWAAPVPPLFGVPPVPCPIPPCTLAPVCYVRTEKATSHIDLGNYFVYDIFPETLDAFYEPTVKDAGYSLAWGQDTAITSTALSGGSLTFPRMVDFDGDGLANQADGGSDPDDSHWDLDGDGLSDYFESQFGSDATRYDTDGDGLPDGAEAREETDPNRRDSDADGLTDLQEIEGWEFVYGFDGAGAQMRTWVTSDPADPDTDGDGLSDFQEKTFGFNPRAYSDPTILTFESEVREADAPSMLLRFEESAGAGTFADASGSGNVGICDAVNNACPTAGVEGALGLGLQFGGVDDLVVVPDDDTLDLTTFSVGAWVRPDGPRSQVQPILAKESADGGERNYAMYLRPDSLQVQFSFHAADCSRVRVYDSDAALVAGQWSHVMMTYDGANFKLFINGSLDRSIALSSTVCQNDAPVKVGGEVNAFLPFQGRIDEASIFDRALSRAEVRAVMAGRYNPDDSFVRPGDTLAYDASVTNELTNRYAQGLLSTEMPGLLAGNVDPTTYVIGPQQEAVMSGSISVDADLTDSARADLIQVAGAVITDRREQSNFAELWLRLDESLGAQSFVDTSGSQPPRTASCTGSQCPLAGSGGAFGYALRFDGSDDRVDIKDTALLKLKETSFTVSAWIKGERFGGGSRAVVGTDGTMPNQGLFLGVVDSVPRMGFIGNGLSSDVPLRTDQWYHVVYRYDHTAQEMAIYVDGEVSAAEAGHAAFQGDGMVMLGRAQSGKYFDGAIDDVRIFQRALSFDEIRELYTQPIFRMGFEEPASSIMFLDETGFESNGVCLSTIVDSCPDRMPGVNGQAADFSGEDYIHVQPNAPLDMSEGQFTISTWVYPDNSGSSTVQSYAQGIFGKYSSHENTNSVRGDDEAYPTLLRVGRKLRFGFGDGDDWIWRTTGDVLSVNAWNHVVVTFGPTYDTAGAASGNLVTIYVDNVAVASWNLGEAAPTGVTKEFYIGRSTDTARVNLDTLYVDDEGDMAGDAELYVMWAGDKIWFDDSCDEGETLQLDQELDYTFDTLLQVWEDDRAGQGEVGPDDLLIEKTFSLSEPGSGPTTLYGEGGYGPTAVTLAFSYPNSALPFHGAVDEMVIYKRAFTEGEVESLYYAGAAGLHMKLDDAPGSSSFENANGPNSGTCSAGIDDATDTCPITGVDGRLGQAALFDGDNDFIEVELDVSEEAYATSMWFNADSSVGRRGIFSVDRGVLSANGQDREIYIDGAGNLCAGVRAAAGETETLCTSGQTYLDDAWHHVVHSVGSGNLENPQLLLHLDDGQAAASAFTAEIYTNKTLSGAPVETNGVPWPLDYDWSDNDDFKDASIRWTGDFYFEGGTYTFQARADDGIRVYIDNVPVLWDWTTHSAKNYTIVQSLSKGVHAIKVEYFQGGGDAVLRFDWTPLLVDDSIYMRNATCSGDSCPVSVNGKLGRALSFDGVNDWVEGPNFDLADDFTISVWVNPDTVTRNQAFVAKNDPYRGNLFIMGFYNDDYYVRIRDASYSAGVPITGWQHLVVVGKASGGSTEVTVYRDGQVLWQETLAATMGNLYGLGWSLGQEWDSSGPSDFYDGKMDEVAIYNRALSLEEVEELFAPHRLYVDGDLVDAGQTSSSSFAGQTGVNVGFAEVSVGSATLPAYFRGRIDDVRVFHQPVSGSGVQTLYHEAPQFQMRFNESVPSCAFQTEIYTNTTLSGPPADERCSGWPISHDWENGGPVVGGVEVTDAFTIRWTGDFYFPAEDTYTFNLRTEDGVRLWVDGVQRSDHWANTSEQDYTVDVTLSAGVHEIRLEYLESSGDASVELVWEPFFTDDSGNANHGRCDEFGTCPTVGVQGQVGLAAEFDGVDDIVVIDDTPASGTSSVLQQQLFSVGGWVMPTAIKSANQPIIAKQDENGRHRNYALFLLEDTTQVRFGFQADDCATWHINDSSGSLMLNGWNHVMMTYDGAYVTLYINGYEDTRAAVSSGVCLTDDPLKMGDELTTFEAYAGRLDEMALYDRALSAREVRETFLYQGKWVEERQTLPITIDADEPVSELRSVRTDAADYRANMDVVLHIAAQDPTSRVTLAELGIEREGTTTWGVAPACMDSAISMSSGVAWCPTFDPTMFGGEGTYTLKTRVTDQVGHRATAAETHTIYVDATPPQVTSSMGGVQPALPHPSQKYSWIVALSGRVTDPDLSDGVAGSGVAAGNVRVTLTASGSPVGAIEQEAVLDGTSWAIDYVIGSESGGVPSGVYEVVVSAEDAVGNSTTATVATITVDADAPASYASVADLPVTITDTVSFEGWSTEKVVPLDIVVSMDAAPSEVGVHLQCGQAELLNVLPGQLLSGSADISWQRLTHRTQSCELRITDSGGNGGTSGAVDVCGSAVTTWDTGYTDEVHVTFVADAATCGEDSGVIGIDHAETAFVPVFQDTALHNPATPGGEILHLTFEEQPDQTGVLAFQDVSGHELIGTCEGTMCPNTTQTGPSGAAATFDGADDAVTVVKPDGASSADVPYFTVSAWVYRTGTNPGRETVVDFGRGVVLSLNEGRWGGVGQQYPVIQAYGDAYLLDAEPVPLETWVHLVAVRDQDGNFRLYRDGQLVASTQLTWVGPATQSPTVIGASDGGTTDFFPGMIDEVRLFDRGLSADEVRSLYLGSGPITALSFDLGWATDGVQLIDGTARQHDGVLRTDDPYNKVIPGKAGAYALTFDGVDDYVSVAPHPGLMLDAGEYTQAAWIYPTPEDSGRMPIIGSGAYHSPLLRYPFVHVVDHTRLQVGFGDSSTLYSFTTDPVLTEAAWNHVVVTFDGTDLTIYVNGVAAVTSADFAGAKPSTVRRFDVGRGGDQDDAYACATLSELTFTAGAWTLYGYKIYVDDVPVWTGRLPVGVSVPVLDRPVDFCGAAQVRLTDPWTGASVASIDIDTEPSSDVAVGTYGAFAWTVTQDAAPMFRGAIDDVRVYARALSATEVRALVNSAWQAAALLGDPGDAVEGWQATVPADLEGLYRLDLRGWDAADHAGNGEANRDVWRGEVDTLAPRVSLLEENVGELVRYTTLAEDFGLTDEAFASPCGPGVVTDREFYADPVYVSGAGAAAGSGRLVALRAECLVDPDRRDIVGVYDTPGLAYDVAVAAGSSSLPSTYAYIIDQGGYLSVVDVSDPTLPVAVSALSLPGSDLAEIVLSEPGMTANALMAGRDGATKAEARDVTAVTPAEHDGVPEAASVAGEVSAGASRSIPPASAAGVGIYLPIKPVAYAGSVAARVAVSLSAGRQVVAAASELRPATGLWQVNQPVPVAQVSSGPDLAVDSLTVTPGAPDYREPFTVTVVISNNGDAPANGFWTGVSADRVLEGCDCCDNGWACSYTDILTQGVTATLTFTHTGFSYAGDHRLYAQVDTYCSLIDDTDLSNNTFGPVTVTVPSMVIVATEPTGNGRAVAAGATISVTFGESVDATTVTSRTFAVRGNQSGHHMGSATVDGSAVRLDTGTGLMPGEDVVVSLSGDIASVTGHHIVPYAWEFRVASGGGTGVLTDTGHVIGYPYESYQHDAWGDVDGDGDLDALLAYSEIEVWLNAGGAQGSSPGDFIDSGVRIPVDDITDLSSLALVDVDNDGDLDVFLVNYGFPGTPNQVWLNDGSGVFADSTQRLGADQSMDVVFGDLDGDGDVDAVVGSASGDEVWRNEGVGTGIFTVTTSLVSNSPDVDLGDLDGDGDLDVVTRMGFWINMGGAQDGSLGDFTLSDTYVGSGAGLEDVRLADLDNDGDLDILFREGAGDNYLWYNQGDGTFVDSWWLQSGAFLGDSLGDVDWDGDLDALLEANIWLNHGSGTFTESVALTETWFEHFALGDVDGDGDLDAVLSDNDVGTRIYENNPGTPMPADISIATPENVPVTVRIVPDHVTNLDGDAVALLSVGAAANGTTHHDAASVTYSPDLSFVGEDVFTYTVQDAGGETGSASVTVSVGGSNSAPVAVDDLVVTDEDVPATIDVLANDSEPDGHTLLLMAVGEPVSGAVAWEGANVVYEPAPDLVGTDAFTYTVGDGSLLDTAWVTVTLTPVNDPPVFEPGPDVTVAEDSIETALPWATDIGPGPATALDEIGQTVIFTVTHDSANLFAYDPTLDGAGVLRFMPDEDAYGAATVTVQAWDDGGVAHGGVDASVPITFTIVVTNVNDAPVVTDVGRTVPEDTVVVINAAEVASDVDDDPLSIVAVGSAISGTTGIVAGTAVYTPDLDVHGTDAFTFTVGDPGGLSAGGRATITLLSVNDTPTIELPNAITVTEDSSPQTVSLSGITSGADNESQPLTVTARSYSTTLVPDPTVSYVSPVSTGSLTFAPVADRSGSTAIEVTVSDGFSETIRILPVTVTPINDAPTLDPLADLSIYVGDGSHEVPLVGIDAGPYETQVLTITASSDAPDVVPDPTVSYTSPAVTGTLMVDPVIGQSGTATIAVTVTDGLSVTVQTFDVTVLLGATRFAYIIDRSGDPGLLVADVSNPWAPALVGHTSVPGYPTGLAVAHLGDENLPHALIASWHQGLQIVDLSDPTVPEVVGEFTGIPGYATDVAVEGETAYVTAGNEGLYILDVSSPTSLSVLGVYKPPIYVLGVAISGTTAYLLTHDGVLMVDVADAAQPTSLGVVDSGWGGDLAVVDQRLYVSRGHEGVAVFDLGAVPSPERVVAVDTPGWAKGVAVSGDILYVADEAAGLQVVSLLPPEPLAKACDRYGHCTTVTPVSAGLLQVKRVTTGVLEVAAADTLAVSVPDLPSVVDRTDPLTFTVEAETLTTTGSLKTLNVTVDAAGVPASVLHTDTWATGTVTEAVVSIGWTPPTAGHFLVTVEAVDHDGHIATELVTVTVDLQPPVVGIASTVVTQTLYHSPNTLDLSGWATDDGGVVGVDVAVLGRAAITGSAALSEDGAGTSWTWQFPWYLGAAAPPDGESFTVVMRATDLVGRVSTFTDTIQVDITPPDMGSLSLQSDGVALAPGTTLRAVTPTLTLSWPMGTDGSDVSGYSVDWTATTTGTAATVRQTQAITPAMARVTDFAALDGQRVAVQVGSTDGLGNEGWQPFGSVVVDSPQTPDFVFLEDVSAPYRGWMSSGCSLVGVDRRLDVAVPDGAALDGEQRFYTTWDAAGLRMAWTGANWATDGDLFVYLDVQPGGDPYVLNPYGGDSELLLPGATPTTTVGAMSADTVIWVWDSTTAVLLQWDGSTWVYRAQLSETQYQYDPAQNGGQTDLYVPFELMGVTDPAMTSLDLVALATEEEGLSLWSVMPNANAVSSSRVLESMTAEEGEAIFALSHRYHWDSLGNGVCPNGSDGSAGTPGGPGASYVDADLQVDLATTPEGTVYSYLADGLFSFWDVLLGDRYADVSAAFANPREAQVYDGQTISYTLSYHNRGSEAATNAYADVQAHGALRLPGGAPTRLEQTVMVGNVAPGETLRVTFWGTVDLASCLTSSPTDKCGWAALDIEIHDDGHPAGGEPLDRIWADHRVDAEAPIFYGILEPTYLIGTGEISVRGYAYDAAGVPTMTVEVEGSGSVICPDNSPDDGVWSCALGPLGANDGDLVNLRLQATDGHGLTSGWSDWRTFQVDAAPPTVTLDLAATEAFPGALLRDSTYGIAGDVWDAGEVARVDVCVDDVCSSAGLQVTTEAAGTAQPVVYEDVPVTPRVINDGTSCGGGELIRTFEVVEDFDVADVTLGFAALHERRDDLEAWLTSPQGTTIQVLGGDDFAGTTPQNYDVLLNDVHSLGLDESTGDDDPTAPWFDRRARPFVPLVAFVGERSAGTWRLSLCDALPGADGVYERSQLVLTPRAATGGEAQWRATAPGRESLDYVTQSVTVTAVDGAGNHTVDPLSFEVIVDNVPPVLAVTDVAATVVQTMTTRVLTGTVSDGGPMSVIYATVEQPSGDLSVAPVVWANDVWTFDMATVYPGSYRLWVTAVDAAGNEVTAGPFDVEVTLPRGRYETYLPTVLKAYTAGPDLVVETLTVSETAVQVVIKNTGTTPVVDAFWVDLYVDPSPVPSEVNQIWSDLAEQGLAWGVTAPVGVGEAVTLTQYGAYYWGDYSEVAWPLDEGTPVYVQVDSANAETDYGGVLELHEALGGVYNNVAGTTVRLGALEAVDGAVSTMTLDRGGLPLRP